MPQARDHSNTCSLFILFLYSTFTMLLIVIRLCFVVVYIQTESPPPRPLFSYILYV